MKRYIVGITGASGAIYGVRLIEALLAGDGREVHLIVSPAGARVLASELDVRVRPSGPARSPAATAVTLPASPSPTTAARTAAIKTRYFMEPPEPKKKSMPVNERNAPPDGGSYHASLGFCQDVVQACCILRQAVSSPRHQIFAKQNIVPDQ